MINFKKIGKKNISLVGMMGSGKSIIGRELSKLYNIDFFDTDSEIEKETGDSINDIFLNYGEVHFRNIEEKVCLKILNNENCIISLGGGSVTNAKIRKIIKKNSYSIYLNVDIDILYKRLKKSTKRPLLNYNNNNNNNNKDKLLELYNERNKFYTNSNLEVINNFNRKEVLEVIDLNINS